jgi:cytochrome b involved in lipid metabolism
MKKHDNYEIEFVISLPHGYGDNRENDLKLKKKIKGFVNASSKFLMARYGDVNILQSNRLDKKLPHYHFFLVPKRVSNNGKNKFYSGNPRKGD